MAVIDLTELLRLEVERPREANELVNLVQNPSGDLGAWGWNTPVAGSALRSVTVSGVRSLRLTAPSPAAATYVVTESMPVAAGRHVAVGVLVTQVTGAYKLQLAWENATGATIGTTTLSPLYTASSTRQVYGTFQAPANTVRVRLGISLYSSTGGTPAAGATLTFREATVADSASAMNLRSDRTNLITNPSAEVNASGWAAITGCTIASSASVAFVGSRSFIAQRGSTAGELRVLAPSVAVTPGRDYAFQVRSRRGGTSRSCRLTVRWLTAGNARIGEDQQVAIADEPTTATWTGVIGGVLTAPSGAATASLFIAWGNVPANEGHYLDAVMVEQSNRVGSYFDGSTAASGGITYSWTGTAHASTSSAVSGAGVLPDLPPVLWQNILGPTTEIGVTRADMDPGQIDVTLRDPALDPSVNPLLRPGRRVRLSTVDGQPILSGKISPDSIQVAYEPLLKNPAKRTLITFTAVDALSSLVAVPRPEGVATVAQLPYVLEGCGVPWSCNGSGDQVPSAPVVAYNSNSTALDQVIVTRDTVRGYAWIDRNGVVQVWDRTQVPTDQKATLTEAVYSPDFASGFDPNSCVNIVEVVALTVVATTGAVEEVRYGPYRDEASIKANGEHPGTYTVQGTWTDSSAAAYASAVLSASANPRRRVREASVAITDASRLPLAILDLQDRVHVQNATAGIAEVSRVTTIRHAIRPGKWVMTLGFAGESVAATPVVVKSPPPAVKDVKADVNVEVQQVAAIADDAATQASSAATAADNAQGTANSAAQAASSAQSTANSAQTTANNAQTAATNAQNTANAKNRTRFETFAPTNQANTAGDVWFVIPSGGGAVISQWQGNGGTSWTQRQVGGSALAADAINGKTITGGRFIAGTSETSGERILVIPNGSGGIVELWTGLSGETTPGSIRPIISNLAGSNAVGLEVRSGKRSGSAATDAVLALMNSTTSSLSGSARQVTLGASNVARLSLVDDGSSSLSSTLALTVQGSSLDLIGLGGVSINGGGSPISLLDLVNATMRNGSVGTGSFRDSVDARVEAGRWTNPAGGVDLASVNYVGTGWQRYGSGSTTMANSRGVTAVSSGLRVPDAGWYQVSGSADFGAGSGTIGRRAVAVAASTNATDRGTNFINTFDDAGRPLAGVLVVSGLMYLAANDILSLYRFTDAANHYGAGVGFIRAVRVG